MLRRAAMVLFGLCVAGCVSTDPAAFRQVVGRNLPIDFKDQILRHMRENRADLGNIRAVRISSPGLPIDILPGERVIICTTLVTKDRIFGGDRLDVTSYDFRDGKLFTTLNDKRYCRGGAMYRPFPEADHLASSAGHT